MAAASLQRGLLVLVVVVVLLAALDAGLTLGWIDAGGSEGGGSGGGVGEGAERSGSVPVVEAEPERQGLGQPEPGRPGPGGAALVVGAGAEAEPEPVPEPEPEPEVAAELLVMPEPEPESMADLLNLDLNLVLGPEPESEPESEPGPDSEGHHRSAANKDVTLEGMLTAPTPTPTPATAGSERTLCGPTEDGDRASVARLANGEGASLLHQLSSVWPWAPGRASQSGRRCQQFSSLTVNPPHGCRLGLVAATRWPRWRCADLQPGPAHGQCSLCSKHIIRSASNGPNHLGL